MPLIQRAPGAGANVSEWLRAAGLLFRQTVVHSAPLAMLAALAAQVPNFYLLAIDPRPVDALPRDPRFWLLFLTCWLIDVVLVGLITLRQQSVLRGQPMSWRPCLARMAGLWPRLALTTLLSLAAIGVGLLLLLVPGVYLAVCFVLLQPLVLTETLNPLAALKRCYQLSAPIWIKLLAAVVFAVLMALVFMLLGGIVIGIVIKVLSGIVPGLADPIGNTLVLLLLALALVYFSALSLVLYTSASASA